MLHPMTREKIDTPSACMRGQDHVVGMIANYIGAVEIDSVFTRRLVEEVRTGLDAATSLIPFVGTDKGSNDWNSLYSKSALHV